MNVGCVHLHVPACIKRLSVNIHELRALQCKHVSSAGRVFARVGTRPELSASARVLS